MSTSRREFLQNGLAFVSLGLAMPTFLMRAAQADSAGAADRALPGIPAGKILVVIEMSGGNDGLNTVIPYADANYAKLRPTIGIQSRDVVKISGNIGLHPSLKPLQKIFDKGNLAVMNGVGYPNPNRSHFHSMDIWQTADPEVDIRERTGWVARYFDSDGHFKANPLSGVTLGSALPLTLFSETAPTSVIGDGRNYGIDNRGGNLQKRMDAIQALYSTGTVAGGNAEFVRNVGDEAYTSTLELKKALKDYDIKSPNAVIYPANNGLASGLQTIAKLVTGGLETRVYYLTIGGFDTHANQPRQHANILGDLADGMAAFYDDLAQQGRANDVTVMTFSEFGRRSKENSSQGTDHGAASIMFIAGGGVKGGIYGDYPSLSDLDDGDLRFHTDFRSIYGTVIDKWLGGNSQSILGGQFKHMDFV